MQIAIVGTGNMGEALAHTFSAAGLNVVIGHRDPGKAAALAEKIGEQAQGGGIEAAFKLADIIVLALPFAALKEVLHAAKDLSGKILVDISNPVSADFKSLLIGHTTSAAEEIQSLAPAAKVVKAFNTIFAQLLPQEGRQGKVLQTLIASDDATAKSEVSKLAATTGLDPVDAGPLSNSRFIEPIGAMNIHLGYFLGWGPVAAPAWLKI